MNARVVLLIIAAVSLFAGEASAITLNYNNLPSSSGFQYSSGGVRQRHYNTNYTTSTGHYHRGGGSSDYYIYAHASCCSSRMILDMPGLAGSFVMGTLRVEDNNSSASWTGFLNGSVVWTAPATGGNGSTFTFPSGAVDEVRLLVPTGGNYGWDDLTVNPCTAANVSAGGPYSVDEGSSIPMAATGTGGTLNFLWDFDGGSGIGPFNDATGANAILDTNTLGWDGPLTATIGVEGSCAGSSLSDITTVNVNNVPPTLATYSGPLNTDEGAITSFVAQGSDPGPVDATSLVYGWDWGDGTSGGATEIESHAWADEGSFTIAITVTDLAGASDTGSYPITIDNVAPIFTSTPDPLAEEGVEYIYAPTVFDPGVNDLLTYSAGPTNPTGVVVSPLAGALTWTPTYADSGTNTLSVTVDDGDGGVTTQTWTATVDLEDLDGDGMADGWEDENGLDSTDPTDAALDPDNDGQTNLDEFLNGTDPNNFDGPTAPVATTPVDGTFVLDFRPTLRWDAATDPNGDSLSYEVEVHEDAGMTSLVVSEAGVISLAWDPTINLDENAEYHWRVRAHDGWTFGPWSNTLWLFVDTSNQPPEAPVPLYPIDAETVADVMPSPEWAPGVDPDRDPLTYDIRVTDDNNALITSGSTAARDTWTLDVALDEDTWYRWSVRAVDDEGLSGPWSLDERFFVSTANAAPGEIFFIAPEEGESIGTQSPVLIATETSDPEGDSPLYHFTLDTELDGGEDTYETWVEHSDTGEVGWLLNSDGIELAPNQNWVARVRAEDSEGVGGSWAQVTFFIRGVNDAPPIPELIAPGDATAVEVAEFEIGAVQDPDGDPVTYRIRVARDEDFTEILAFDENIEAEGDTISWAPSGVSGSVFWTARAVDNSGVASDWAEPWEVAIGGPLAGCDNCESTLVGRSSAPRGAALVGLFLALCGLRRRRSVA